MHPYISGWLAAVLACRLLLKNHLLTMSLTYTILCTATDVGMRLLAVNRVTILCTPLFEYIVGQ